MKTESLIHLRVPAATKGRWVRVSRASGKRLTDWIVDAVEAHIKQQMTKVAIPDDLSFDDLHLGRNTSGDITFDWSAIERICLVSRLPVEMFKDAPEDNVCSLIIRWYQVHRQHGGESDPVAEDLMAEESAGQTVSHRPGQV